MRRLASVLTACLLSSSLAFATDDDSHSLKEDFRQLGHAFRDAGKSVGKAAVKVTHKVAKRADEKLNGSGAKESKQASK